MHDVSGGLVDAVAIGEVEGVRHGTAAVKLRLEEKVGDGSHTSS